MLQVTNLHVAYGELPALQGVSLKIQPGELVALVGPNGAGKTTLLKTISGLLPARAGTVRWQDEAINEASPQRIVERGIALVPEGRKLFAAMTVRENLELGAFILRAQKEKFSQLEKIFALFPRLAERQRQRAGSLSGGEQQMLALGRALMGLPRLLLLDEPSLGLAPRVVESMMSILSDLHRGGMSVLIVEQNVHAVLALAERAYILEGGRIVDEGEGRKLLEDDHVRAAYLGPLVRVGES
ncbi:MAG TPA: ABC transporter ATP-binding protein [Candidatus Binatia bacterium]|nr:ABC transporter ATP-binding protein [Candidatus Binatia bacterium]HEU5463400.1 ABC transporter ATP-binding protein [Candidatus Binatia bacterium]HEX5020363.1 ABC transporter ATP-binding protein [Candidatus Binatia bacterium]